MPFFQFQTDFATSQANAIAFCHLHFFPFSAALPYLPSSGIQFSNKSHYI
jgi:hypothetical protein